MAEYEGHELWWRWVLANARGAVLGGSIGLVLSLPFFFVCGYYSIMFAPLVGGLVFGIVVSGTQSLFFWPFSGHAWTVLSVLGGLIALPLGAIAGGGGQLNIPGWIVGGLVGGAVVGLAQWLVLRTIYPRAGNWVLANAGAWAVGVAGAQVLYALIFGAEGYYGTSADGIGGFVLYFVALPLARSMIAVVLAAAITGGALLGLQHEVAADKPVRPHDQGDVPSLSGPVSGR
jgi:hypothetical protein